MICSIETAISAQTPLTTSDWWGAVFSFSHHLLYSTPIENRSLRSGFPFHCEHRSIDTDYPAISAVVIKSEIVSLSSCFSVKNAQRLAYLNDLRDLLGLYLARNKRDVIQVLVIVTTYGVSLNALPDAADKWCSNDQRHSYSMFEHWQFTRSVSTTFDERQTWRLVALFILTSHVTNVLHHSSLREHENRQRFWWTVSCRFEYSSTLVGESRCFAESSRSNGDTSWWWRLQRRINTAIETSAYMAQGTSFSANRIVNHQLRRRSSSRFSFPISAARRSLHRLSSKEDSSELHVVNYFHRLGVCEGRNESSHDFTGWTEVKKLVHTLQQWQTCSPCARRQSSTTSSELDQANREKYGLRIQRHDWVLKIPIYLLDHIARCVRRKGKNGRWLAEPASCIICLINFRRVAAIKHRRLTDRFRHLLRSLFLSAYFRFRFLIFSSSMAVDPVGKCLLFIMVGARLVSVASLETLLSVGDSLATRGCFPGAWQNMLLHGLHKYLINTTRLDSR